MNQYSHPGTRVTAVANFTDIDGVPADPTTVSCEVKSPSGTTSTPTATSTEVGTWEALVDLTEPGIWWVRFEGTGALVVAVERQIYAAPTQF